MKRRLSPAQRHYIRVTAAQQAAVTEDEHGGPAPTSSTYELMLSKLKLDGARLKELQSVERKIDLKRHLLPEYLDYVAGVMDGDHGGQDEVFMRVLIWRIDVGDIRGALPMAAYALRHSLTPPDSFSRSLGCLLAEEVAEHALLIADGAADTPIELLLQTHILTDREDMPDEVRAKLHKATGRAYLAQIDPNAPQSTDMLQYEHALGYFHRALQLHEKCGVKKDIEAVERAMKKIAGQAPPAS